jgi:threonine dehydrogenase-like Zn-dependent dehydrogenase
MRDVLAAYKKVDYPLPERMLVWPTYGAGMESLGRDGKPVEWDVPQPGPRELLVRHDANGLCFSDLKIIKAGGSHPRLYGRDLAADPIVQGHEVALTVVKVGEELRGQYHVGDRFIVQADIYYKGVNLAYGYMLVGGLAQYAVIGKEMLEGDEGVYLLPIPEGRGYAEAALVEPWACIEAACVIHPPDRLKPGGVAWFVGAGGEDREYTLSRGLEEDSHPDKIIMSGLPPGLTGFLRQRSEALGIHLVELPAPSAEIELERLLAESANGTCPERRRGEGLDDIVVLGAERPEIVEWASQKLLARNGTVNIVATKPLPRLLSVDVGRIHYDGLNHVGTSGADIAAAYDAEASELKAGSVAWFMGAAGPMGQMYTQRAVSMRDGPRRVVASDLLSSRLEQLEQRIGPQAAANNVELICLNPKELGPEEYRRRLVEATGGRGFEAIVVLAPATAAVEEAQPFLAAGGLLNIFAGLPRGTIAALDLSAVYLKGHRFLGSSGSTIADMRRTLRKVTDDELITNRSLAAIGGIYAVRDGMEAMRDGLFPGKVVIYPQITDLPLTPLEELGRALPTVAARLEDGQFWTREAEEELLRLKLDLPVNYQ